MQIDETTKLTVALGNSLKGNDLDSFIDAVIDLFAVINGIVSFNIYFKLPVFGFGQQKFHRYKEQNNDTDLFHHKIPLDDEKGGIGVINLRLDSNESLSNYPVLVNLVPLLVTQTYKNFWLSSMMETITQPVPFHADEATFIRNLCELLCDATGARFVVLRIQSVNEFRCVGAYDREHPTKHIEIDKIGVANHPDLYKYLSDFIRKSKSKSYRCLSFISSSDPELKKVKKLLNEERIQSALTVPLMRGGESIGIISFLFDNEISLSQLVYDSYLLLANHTAVTYEYFQESRLNAHLLVKRQREFIEKVNFEIMQGLRHSAFNNIGKARTQLAIIESDLPEDQYNNLSSSLLDVSKDLEGMRALTAKQEQEPELVCINECFKHASEILDNRIRDNDVKVNNAQKKEYIWGVPSAITYAFLNAIINSLDSFKYGTKSAQKTITFHFVSSTPERIAFDISDNGPGFRPKGSVHSVEQVWEPGKTTRSGGTGYGLPMIREVFQHIHKGGTVRIQNWKNGFTLRVQMFRYPEAYKEKFENAIKSRG